MRPEQFLQMLQNNPERAMDMMVAGLRQQGISEEKIQKQIKQSQAQVKQLEAMMRAQFAQQAPRETAPPQPQNHTENKAASSQQKTVQTSASKITEKKTRDEKATDTNQSTNNEVRTQDKPTKTKPNTSTNVEAPVAKAAEDQAKGETTASADTRQLAIVKSIDIFKHTASASAAIFILSAIAGVMKTLIEGGRAVVNTAHGATTSVVGDNLVAECFTAVALFYLLKLTMKYCTDPLINTLPNTQDSTLFGRREEAAPTEAQQRQAMAFLSKLGQSGQ